MIRSFGCVLYEMTSLEKAFPEGPLEKNGRLNFPNFSEDLVYGSILEK